MASSASTLSWAHPYTWAPSPSARQTPSRSAAFTVIAQKKVKKTRQVILKEDMGDLGKSGDLVSVRAGYFRNFLHPRGKAMFATTQMLKEIQIEKERIDAERKRAIEEVEQFARALEDEAFIAKRKSGEKGKQIFGTVTSEDLVQMIKAQLNREVDKRIISMPEIREAGFYVVEIKLHPEVTALVRVSVVAE